VTATLPEAGAEPAPGTRFPDLELPDHTGRIRTLSEVAGGDPVLLLTSRGWWCPKEQRHLRGLVRLQDEFEVGYARIAVVSVDPPEVQAAFRAGLGARFLFLSDHERRYLDELGLRETTDTVHHPYLPAAFTLFPDLRVHRAYNGYWFWGRPTAEEIRRDMREITREIRPDWDPPREGGRR
jgi:peroxiredoxin